MMTKPTATALVIALSLLPWPSGDVAAHFGASGVYFCTTIVPEDTEQDKRREETGDMLFQLIGENDAKSRQALVVGIFENMLADAQHRAHRAKETMCLADHLLEHHP